PCPRGAARGRTRRAARLQTAPEGRSSWGPRTARRRSRSGHPGEDLILLDDDMVGAVDPLDPRRPIAERLIDAGLPQIGRFEQVRVGRQNHGQHRRPLFSHLIAGNSFGNRPITVKVSVFTDPRLAASRPAWGRLASLVITRTAQSGACQPTPPDAGLAGNGL